MNESKISISNDWPLIVFTWIGALLVGLFGAHLVSDVPLNPLAFLGLGLGSMVLSTGHLGRKRRAFRAIRNWQHSWLSREILFFVIFLGLGTFACRQIHWGSLLGIVSMAFGIFCLISMDAVYLVIPENDKTIVHSAQATLMALWVFAVFAGFTWLLVAVFVLRAALYARRKRADQKHHLPLEVSVIRSAGGFFLPAVLWFLEFLMPLAVIASLAGDIIDRLEFYAELEPASPEETLSKIKGFRNS